MTQTAKELSDQITKAMEGVTPGPWHVDPKAAEESFFEDVSILRHDGLAVAVCVHNGDILPPEPEKNAGYIAAVQPNNIRVILSALADAELQSTADSRIAELEQQIANIKASRDCQVTIAAGEEERARKAESELDQWKMAAIGQQGVTMAAVSELSRVEAKLAEAVKVMEQISSSGRIPNAATRSKWITIPARVFSHAQMFLASMKGGDA
ncbi:hypothetical protein G6L45_16075 [Agrobacterium rhizogenes]|nr:hypothetical protein [Rhizobium rhizogenes]NTH97002.1 hypothetical protein [Rhizobium rhizogenes]NTJ15188.1 hypothetical protein [Rhizobium rhizogenes]